MLHNKVITITVLHTAIAYDDSSMRTFPKVSRLSMTRPSLTPYRACRTITPVHRRIDVVPKEYIKELVMLQDNVPGFGFEAAARILEEDLGQPIDQLYDSFNEVPVAAASLGQVSQSTTSSEIPCHAATMVIVGDYYCYCMIACFFFFVTEISSTRCDYHYDITASWIFGRSVVAGDCVH